MVEDLTKLSSLPREIPRLFILREIRESGKDWKDELPGVSRFRVAA